ncbi:dual specificity protein phosphatase 3 [Trichonephila inaurata madagascariensis]|uniref:Dual specificity protein phosphatase n=1 Tax=Trichonephila inaurata madagascariensis TaxID=2747483 RepID=A0A8X7BP35_9ARAC|nr:dual specificity protein phosphatase 3 [Trichonephila inaurata madagascariensis]
MFTPSREPLCTLEELRGICMFPSGGFQAYPTQDCDEVYPGIFIGNDISATNLEFLDRSNIGYVLNAAHGLDSRMNMIEPMTERQYSLRGIRFLGIPAIDSMSYPIDRHFDEAIHFIREALQSGKNILVHCKQGISRSAALVLAYLIAEQRMSAQEATRTVRQRREIMPNDGFLMQLCNLNEMVNKRY